MCLFASPMLLLYIVGVATAFLVHPDRRKAREAKMSA
jgi:sec-independent protein translocase protein TatC